MNRAGWLGLIAVAAWGWTGAASEPANQVLGYYSAGKLSHPSHLVLEGKGLLHIFQSRNRGFGSEGWIDMIEKAAAEISDLFPQGERVQVADIAQETGGLLSGHASHQNGLDGDVIYMRINHQEYQPSDPQMTESFVVNGKISSNFDAARNFKLFQLLISSGRVNRIFVDPVIKGALCGYAASHATASDVVTVLSHLQPYPNHDNHFHMRITCPKESPNCKDQAALSLNGSGCKALNEFDSTLVPFEDHGARDEE